MRSGRHCICNFSLNLDRVRGKREKHYVCMDNSELTPEFLIDYANRHNAERKCVREGSILLVIDECQLLFNSRDWGKKGRDAWLRFFTLHRHLGYDIILVAQFDRMIDRQIRSLIEYEYKHRKVSNYGWKGKVISFFALGNLFVSVKMWYPLREKIGSSFFRANRLYYSLYDTHVIFDSPE